MNEIVIAQLLEQNPGGLREYSVGGGCESCGSGSQNTVCILCGERTFEYASQYKDHNMFGNKQFPHRKGCSIPLILKAQHEAGLHQGEVA